MGMAAVANLCVLCGLPAAGKSTLARALVAELRAPGPWNSVFLSYDDLIPEEAFQLTAATADGDSRSGTLSFWKSYRQKLLVYLEHLIQSIASNSYLFAPANGTDTTWECFLHCLKQQNLISSDIWSSDICHYRINKTAGPLFIILDDNFYYQSMRYEVYQLARKYSLGFCQVFLDCPFEVCTQRNSQRSCPIPDETLMLMRQKMESPNPEKNSWEQNSLILQSGDCVLEDIHKVITLFTTALEHPEKPLEDNTKQTEADRAICASSILHQSDQSFRKLVSQAMKTARDSMVPPSTMKLLAEELNKLKAFFLEDLRSRTAQGRHIDSYGTITEIVTQVIAHFDREKKLVLQKFLPKNTESPA